MPEEDHRQGEEEEVDVKTDKLIEKMNDPDAMKALGEVMGDFIRSKLAERSPLADILVALPSPPYELARENGITHYAGFVHEKTRFVRACDGGLLQITDRVAGVVPTCLMCARVRP